MAPRLSIPPVPNYSHQCHLPISKSPCPPPVSRFLLPLMKLQPFSPVASDRHQRQDRSISVSRASKSSYLNDARNNHNNTNIHTSTKKNLNDRNGDLITALNRFCNRPTSIHNPRDIQNLTSRLRPLSLHLLSYPSRVFP